MKHSEDACCFPFVTGSHRYGEPTDQSDIDLVVYCSEEDAARLAATCDKQEEGPEQADDYPSTSLRFGKLNLIVVTTTVDYDIWREGTLELEDRSWTEQGFKPITRDEAVKHFDALRKARS